MNTMRPIHILIMLCGDMTLFLGALYISLWIRYLDLPSTYIYQQHIYAFSILFMLYELMLFIAGLWDRRFVPTPRKTFDLLFPAHILATLVMVLYFYIFLPFLGISPKTNLLLFSVILFVGTYLWKSFGTRVFTLNPARVVSLGDNQEIQKLLSSHPLWNVEIVDTIATSFSSNDIVKALKKSRSDVVLVDMHQYPQTDILYKLIFENITILDTLHIKEEITQRVDLDYVDELWFISHIRYQQNLWQSFTKRFFDILLALPLIVLYIIILPFVALAIKFEDGGPVFYKMDRVGHRGQIFSLQKFRSMRTTTRGNGQDNASQITRVGAWLRKTSLDEFPQVWSIIRGYQSFVGPRPEIPSLVSQYSEQIPHYNMRHLVRPGLSGWAQINAPAPHHKPCINLTQEKLSFDLYYIKYNSTFLYIKIVLQTLGTLFNRKNH